MNEFKKYFSSKLLQFSVVFGVLYVFWLILYYAYITSHTGLDYQLNYNIAEISIWIFDWFDVKAVMEIDSDHVVISLPYSNYRGIWVGDNCNGFKLFSIFSIFIIAYPVNWRSKLWFIPLGLGIVHLANIIRIMSLILINDSHPEYLDFNHDYTFTIFVYSIIFGLWYWWLNKYSPTNEKE